VDFLQNFVNARNVGTPIVKVNTPDNASTIASVIKSLGKAAVNTPLAVWDSINGLKGISLNGDDEGCGTKTIMDMIQASGLDKDATTSLPITLQIVNNPEHKDFILFVRNPHLFWNDDPLVIQGIWNCRDPYKANGMMIILMTPLGTLCPPDLNNDVLSLEEALPTRKEIRQYAADIYKQAGAKLPSETVFDQIGDALVGIPAFPIDQALAMNIDRVAGVMNVKGLWDRKRGIISATPGLSFANGDLTFADMGGNKNIADYVSKIMAGKRGANVILRVDEIEKAFAGAGTDTSGVKGDLLGNFLAWVEDKKVFCILCLGVPGASKSHFIYCIGGQFGKPVLNFDIAGMQDSLVGNSGKNLRNSEATVEAISDGQIILIATANSLRGLPAELLSRFEKGGIFFFDVPDESERADILALKVKMFNITLEQSAGFNIKMTEGWTGREIESLCDKADRTGVTLVEAAKYVVPLTESQKASIDELRESAANKYLSASKPGRYTFTKTTTVIDHSLSSTVAGLRKLR
jgi:hypothetical protein